MLLLSDLQIGPDGELLLDGMRLVGECGEPLYDGLPEGGYSIGYSAMVTDEGAMHDLQLNSIMKVHDMTMTVKVVVEKESTMKSFLAKFWPKSKKTRATLISLLMLGLAPLAVKLGVDPAVVERWLIGGVGVLSVYVLGQGIADKGKETKKIEEQVRAWESGEGPKPEWIGDGILK